MRNRIILPISVVVVVSLLSGCSPLRPILNQVSSLAVEQALEQYSYYIAEEDWNMAASFFALPATIEFYWNSAEGTLFHPDPMAGYENRPPRWEVPDCYISLDAITEHDLSTGCSVVSDPTPVFTAYTEDMTGWVHLYRAEFVTEKREPLKEFLKHEYGFVWPTETTIDFNVTNAYDALNGGYGTAIITITRQNPYDDGRNKGTWIWTRVDEVEFSLVEQGGRKLISSARMLSSTRSDDFIPDEQ